MDPKLLHIQETTQGLLGTYKLLVSGLWLSVITKKPQPIPMAKTAQTPIPVVDNKNYVYLNELEVGKHAVVKLNAKNNISHHFITLLKEGCVYLLKHFEVIPNREEYRILKDNKMMIQLQGATYLKKHTITATSTFIWHLFDCIEIEDLVPTDDKYLVDFAGHVINVGSPKDQRTGAATLDFDLANERGQKMTVTLWGKLGPDFLEKKPASPAIHCITLTSVFVKKNYFEYKWHAFSSSMDLPGDDEYCSPVRHFPLPKEGTLAELLDMVRKRMNNVLDVFKCQVELTDIRMKNGWYYTTCSICKSKKGKSRKFQGFCRQICNVRLTFELKRFRIEFEVRNATVETVVLLFDKTVEQLTNITAQCLLVELDKDCVAKRPGQPAQHHEGSTVKGKLILQPWYL
ncbi:uncharacterized protein [Rutidosis leptorrhynchoides]|uniref:uncharacterized protein n=1 Tax=Rutidosis leptorrhynchoides TaxID=125765 RepID=UPI003A9A340B